MDALERAIKLAGTQQKLAEKVGSPSQTTVSEWKRRGRVPAESVIAVAVATDYQVTPHQLRPDLYPFASDGLPAEKRPAIVA